MSVSDSPIPAPAGCSAEGKYHSRLPAIRLNLIFGVAHLQAGYIPQISEHNFPIDTDTSLGVSEQVLRDRHYSLGFA
jgi:hypothetical protein